MVLPRTYLLDKIEVLVKESFIDYYNKYIDIRILLEEFSDIFTISTIIGEPETSDSIIKRQRFFYTNKPYTVVTNRPYNLNIKTEKIPHPIYFKTDKPVRIDNQFNKPLTLEHSFNNFLDILEVLFYKSSLQRVCRILGNLGPEDSLFKKRYTQYLQRNLSIISFVQTGDTNKDFELRQIFREQFKDYFKNTVPH